MALFVLLASVMVTCMVVTITCSPNFLPYLVSVGRYCYWLNECLLVSISELFQINEMCFHFVRRSVVLNIICQFVGNLIPKGFIAVMVKFLWPFLFLYKVYFPMFYSDWP